MASWAHLNPQSSGTPLGFQLGELARKKADVRIDDANMTFDRAQGFNRASHDTVASFSARGAGRSSAKNLATNRMFEDYSRDTGKQQLGVGRALDDLKRQRRLATFGVLY